MDEDQIELLGELLGVDPYYLLGEDEEDPLLGARPAMHRRVTSRRGMSSRARLRSALVPKTPGVPKPGGRELVLGFPVVQFTNTSALAFNTTAAPQVPFKGRRLVIIATRSAAGSGGALTMTDLRVGQRSQLVSAQPVPIEAYQADAYGGDMAIDPATPGTDIVLSVAAAAQPGVGETVDIAACIIGLSVA